MLVNIEKLSEEIGLAAPVIELLVKAGAIPHLKLPRAFLFDIEAVQAALAKLAAEGVDLSSAAAIKRWRQAKGNVRRRRQTEMPWAPSAQDAQVEEEVPA